MIRMYGFILTMFICNFLRAYHSTLLYNCNLLFYLICKIQLLNKILFHEHELNVKV